MAPITRQFRDFFVSLKLTVVLLALSIVLVFWATLEQTKVGIWGVQQKFFHSLFVLWQIPNTSIPIPVFPGGYFIGGLLLINLITAHFYRFKFEWHRAGIQLTHFGLILLLLGELLTGLWQRESQMQIHVNERKSYTEDIRFNELAIINKTDPKLDDVVAISDSILSDSNRVIQHPKLPFQVKVCSHYPNAMLQVKEQVPPNFIPAPNFSNQGIGPRLALFPMSVTYKENDRNAPAAEVELIGSEGSLGVWLVSVMLSIPQTFEYQGHTWEVTLRSKRYYELHSIELLKVTHDVYPGTDIPKNFSSCVRVKSNDGHDDREVFIYMNNPLRYRGLTYYQYQMDGANGLSVFQVVRNPSWILPYISCLMMSTGLVIQFCLHLVGFLRCRQKSAA